MTLGKKFSKICLGGLMMLLILLSGTAAFAEGGGRSDTPGIPGQKPLSLISVTLADGGSNVQGAANIPLKPKFMFVFDKNVVNSLVWVKNSSCFKLVSQDNKDVPVSVTKVDDTIDFSQRQNVFVEPVNPLKPGTTYNLIVLPELMAKNGVSTLGGTTGGKGVTSTFKTAGEAPKASVQPPAQNTPTPTVKKQVQQSVQKPVVNLTETPKTSDQASAESQDKTGVKSTAEQAANAGAQNIQPTEDTSRQQQDSQPVSKSSGTASGAEEKTDQRPTSSQKQTVDYSKWLTPAAVLLIVAWIGVEIFVKRRKRG